MRDRRERCDRQGRVVLPAHRQEAPARPGGRRAEPPPVHLPGRFGRRVPPAPGGGVPRPRRLRADLLQPGAHVGARHPADCRGDGVVHRGRRVRAGDERRDGDRPGHRHDLHRRPAARAGGDRPGGDGRGARRRRRPHAPVGGGRPLRDRRRTRAGDRAAHRRQRTQRQAGAAVGGPDRPNRPPSILPISTA